MGSWWLMSEESDSLKTSPSAASLADNELPPAPEPPGYVCSLTGELVAKAREELQEKPEWRLRDVQALRDMVRKECPHLRTSLDDAFLLRFLRARKFDYDRALQLLINYHSCRRSWPEVFNNLKPSALKDVLASGFLTVLPHTDPRGCHILCIRPDRWIPSNYPITENIRAIYLTLEKLIQAEETQVNGIVILADYKGVSLSKASHFGPFIAKKVIGILQDGFPIRIKAVHVVNEPRIFKGIFAIIKPFLKEKIANRRSTHSAQRQSQVPMAGLLLVMAQLRNTLMQDVYTYCWPLMILQEKPQWKSTYHSMPWSPTENDAETTSWVQ
ncbi:alpha-tocopherol transfer protein-like isoform X4 [Molossus molossus]|uniref:alpha-tocopherol transfer protein-like isoform X4 n=1 Tax=Molossus molossus TaxID=27622 RepID=UPI001747997C|nr:alpha-tocopherol transfer protein-like isoform X4 [Molossus molossus]